VPGNAADAVPCERIPFFQGAAVPASLPFLSLYEKMNVAFLGITGFQNPLTPFFFIWGLIAYQI